MIKLTFGDSIINLYDDYIIITTNSNIKKEDVKIYKNEIASFFMDITYHTSRVRSGSIVGTARITKGIYVKKSTPYYKNVTTKRYTPKLVLKSKKSIYFNTIMQNDTIRYSIYTRNIRRFYLWLNCTNLNEFNRKEQVAQERLEKEVLNSFNLDYGNLSVIWIIAFIVSFFTGNTSFIIFMMYVPIIFFLGLTILNSLRNKRWKMAIFKIVIASLFAFSFYTIS